MTKPTILVLAWLPEGQFEQLRQQWPEFDVLDGRTPAGLDAHLGSATILYGLPPLARLSEAGSLRWIQLPFAGVPRDLCPMARERGLIVTNLSGLYGPSMAEHALALMTLLARNLHTALRNQAARRWERGIAGAWPTCTAPRWPSSVWATLAGQWPGWPGRMGCAWSAVAARMPTPRVSIRSIHASGSMPCWPRPIMSWSRPR